MRPDALAAAIAADVAAGRRPAAVVASVGTTATTAVDPVAAIADVLGEVAGQDAAHRPWLHIDAAMAGAALLLPERRDLVGGAGVERADSLSWNPHKWLGTILDCSLLYVRDTDHLVRVLSTDPSYLRSASDQARTAAQVPQYKDWGIPLGRRFRALKLWFQLRLDGLESIRIRLRRDLDNAAWLAAQVEADPQWRLLAPLTLQTVCLRHEPAALLGPEGPDGERLDAHTLAWAESVNASGRAFVTPSLLNGRWMVRVSVGAEATEREHVAEVWELLRQTSNKLSKDL
jgi:aromatic-L-amino-acid decarboxylase